MLKSETLEAAVISGFLVFVSQLRSKATTAAAAAFKKNDVFGSLVCQTEVVISLLVQFVLKMWFHAAVSPPCAVSKSNSSVYAQSKVSERPIDHSKVRIIIRASKIRNQKAS